MTWLMHGLTIVWWLLLFVLSAWTLAHALAWGHRGLAPGRLYSRLLAETQQLMRMPSRANGDYPGRAESPAQRLELLPADSALRPILLAASRGVKIGELELMQEQLLAPLLSRLFDSLGLMTRAAPLAGLALTLIGVDQSMTAYAANPADVVGMISGIGTALRSTLIGMGVSVIAMALEMQQRRRVERLQLVIAGLVLSMRTTCVASVTDAALPGLRPRRAAATSARSTAAMRISAGGRTHCSRPGRSIPVARR